ncbi:MAG TPA: twin-arginine translocase TatA/TatE family subunit [Polyangia bacterium]|nr:twin-arginine translocase TatA/TatE family subunit [Polyangia bacterium]
MHTLLATVPLIGMPGMWEWIIILLVVLLLFGATKLPKLGKGLGAGIRNFKEGLRGDKDPEDEGEVIAEAKKGGAGGKEG